MCVGSYTIFCAWLITDCSPLPFRFKASSPSSPSTFVFTQAPLCWTVSPQEPLSVLAPHGSLLTYVEEPSYISTFWSKSAHCLSGGRRWLRHHLTTPWPAQSHKFIIIYWHQIFCHFVICTLWDFVYLLCTRNIHWMFVHPVREKDPSSVASPEVSSIFSYFFHYSNQGSKNWILWFNSTDCKAHWGNVIFDFGLHRSNWLDLFIDCMNWQVILPTSLMSDITFYSSNTWNGECINWFSVSSVVIIVKELTAI